MLNVNEDRERDNRHQGVSNLGWNRTLKIQIQMMIGWMVVSVL